jgi:hypothetical protein
MRLTFAMLALNSDRVGLACLAFLPAIVTRPSIALVPAAVGVAGHQATLVAVLWLVALGAA